MSFKKCNICKQSLDISLFGNDKNSPDGRNYGCKSCKKEQAKKYRATNPEKIKALNDSRKESRKKYYGRPEIKRKFRNESLKKQFGLTIEEFDKMNLKQNGLCAICSRNERSERNKHLAVDHCHKNGAIRGLLCSNCNRALGLLEDSVEILKKAIDYLKRKKV